ncbi:MAG: pilus assembly protein TadG-related protein [Rickettsiales bacterium]
MRHAFCDNRDGSVMLIVVLSILAVVGAVGVSVDVARAQMVQAKLQNAVDAAGLAAGATLSTNDLTTVATKYVNANFKQGTLGATLGPVTANLSSDNQIVTVTAYADVPRTIMAIFGNSQVRVDASSEITRSNAGMELALVLDITGSMWTNNNHIKLRDAATQLIDILYGPNDTNDNLWVSVVPFVTSVNIGSQSKATSWLRDNYTVATNDTGRYPASYPVATYPKWKGCIEERTGGLDVTDDAPDAATPGTLWNMFYWPSTGVPATTTMAFSANPLAGQSITLNGVQWKFVTSGASGAQTNIKANLNATLTQLATDLNASTMTAIKVASYSNSGGTGLAIANKGTGRTGGATFTANPNNNDTKSINGVTWRFVTGTPTGTQTKIQANLVATLTQLQTDLNSSTNNTIRGSSYATYDSDATPGVDSIAWFDKGDNYWYNPTTGVAAVNEAVDYQNSGTSGGYGPNISCGNSVLALTASKTTVKNKVAGLYPWRKGGTMSNVGLAWGWRMLSPKWRGQWDAEKIGGQDKLPLDYRTPLMQKAIVIETDGANGFFKSASTTPPYSDYTAMLRLDTTAQGGRSDINTQNAATGITLLNDKTTALCNAIKAQGILIYTVTFGLGNSPNDNTARTLFRNCATEPSYYFDANSTVPGATQIDLTTAFKTIGDSLANLRISH